MTTTKHSIIMTLLRYNDATAHFTSPESEDPAVFPERSSLRRDVWDDMGNPDTITVMVFPGDQLNPEPKIEEIDGVEWDIDNNIPVYTKDYLAIQGEENKEESMTEERGEVQDPAEPYQVDQNVETSDVEEGEDTDFEGAYTDSKSDEVPDAEPVQVDVNTPDGQPDVHVESGESEASSDES